MQDEAIKPKRKREATIRVRMKTELRDAIQEAAEEDDQAMESWMRIVAVAVLRKRGRWPRP